MWINDLKDKVDALERQILQMADIQLELKRRIEALERDDKRLLDDRWRYGASLR